MKASNERKNFIILLALVNAVVLLANCQWRVRSYNTTMLALDYRHGFTSRALLGTIYHRLDDLLPVNMISYEAVCVFAGVVTVGLAGLLVFFAERMLKKTAPQNIHKAKALLLMLSIPVMATFSGGYNMLRVDEFMLATSLVAVMLLLYEKREWLAVPLSAIGVMFHQGYVFMYFNIILVILLWKALDAKEKKRQRYYGVLFAASFLVGSALFLYFELFSRSSGEAVYAQVLSDAKALSYQGIYHSTLLAHEVLGIDLGDTEYGLRMVNRIQMPVYIVCMLPYLALFFSLFLGMIRKAAKGIERWKYLIVFLGAFTMLPDFLLKVDYGRWLMAVLSYYLVILLYLTAVGDAVALNGLGAISQKVKSHPALLLFVVYPLFFLPYWDVDICELTRTINRWLDELFRLAGLNIYDYVKWY